MRRSECRVWFVTYRGAFVKILRMLDLYLCIISIMEFEAQPHSSIPYVHTGLRTVLYMVILFSSDSVECL